MYCLDTSTLSATGLQDPPDAGEALRWLDENAHAIYVPAVVLAEIEYGIARLELAGAAAKAAKLRQWLAAVRNIFSGRIEAIDSTVALRAGQVRARAAAGGADIGMTDSLIAAVADLHGWPVLTANQKHFARAGVACADVFRGKALPPGQMQFPFPPDPCFHGVLRKGMRFAVPARAAGGGS